MQRPAIFMLVILTIALASRKLRAESGLVVLVRPSAQSAVASEAIPRIRGELIVLTLVGRL